MLKKFLGSMTLAVALMALAVMPVMAYEVKSGDTMEQIAKAHNLTLWELSTLNPQITNLDLIYIGEEIITKHEHSPPATKPYNANDQLTEYEQKLLSQLVFAEARGESFTGKVAVAEVVLNRLESEEFPDTVKGVIYQPRQFVPASTGSIYNNADADSVRAVEVALSGTNYTHGALYFYDAKTATNRWLDDLPTIVKIGVHTFK